MTQDGEPICRGSPNLLSNTDIAANSDLSSRVSSVPQLNPPKGIYSFNLTLKEIQTLKGIMHVDCLCWIHVGCLYAESQCRSTMYTFCLDTWGHHIITLNIKYIDVIIMPCFATHYNVNASVDLFSNVCLRSWRSWKVDLQHCHCLIFHNTMSERWCE